ncbi:uncharacterized protein LOC127831486 [Dreissena polymorpha]|uniref:uncharacterized protein LOC127831486 n=1 Tax=Dreissena polymorpha TaxID=45954 RepID=UPI0022649A86|nr:uncharacterized protein LOC127831486 [Dreissena polymorpha]
MRVDDSPPFAVTGVDFTGALSIRESSGSEKKVYICLFTCASTRAVQLEVVPNLTEDAFMNAFRRFASRKSMPHTVLSDNATTFKAASRHLQNLMQSPSIQRNFSNMGITWKFIPTRAPWYGGWWERLIGVTKSAVKKT